MKKLYQITLAMLLIAGSTLAQAQPAKKADISKSYSHQANFRVYDFTTKLPVSYAVLRSRTGEDLGYTDQNGHLSINLPPNTNEFYSIVAEGYNPMNIRLTQSEKKTGEYEVFLPSAEIGYSRVTASIDNTPTEIPKEELVKVYVKQDPATYQKKSGQGPVITFSVQVAASSKLMSEKSDVQQWSDVGQVYIQEENGMYKVRIGPYETQKEAKDILLKVKSKGRNDAFIVVHQNGENDPPIVHAEVREEKPSTVEVVSEPQPVEEQPEVKHGIYKVRVASYLHPGTFNPEGLEKLGELESYRRGEWTIMMIGGFTNLEAARSARKIVISKGFTDASIVVDNQGILETIEEN